MRDHLDAYHDEMLSVEQDDIIGQASLLWKVIYASVHNIQQSNSDFIVVRHEDLSLDPVNGYRELYSLLDLDFSTRVQKFVEESSSSENPRELSRRKIHSVKMDSASQVKNWKKRLSEETVKRIRGITEETSKLYYSNEDWE